MNSLNAIWAIAVNTFRETVRERIIYAFMLFAFAITLFANLLGTLSVGQDMQILEDIGLAAIALIGGIIAVFAGTNLVYKELERRTVYIIFTKPVTGWQFVLGKYIGLAFCILMVISAMGAFLTLLIWFSGNPSPANLLGSCIAVGKPLLLVYVELLFVIASATFFSTFASPVMSVIFTLSLWLIAHFTESLKELAAMSQDPALHRLSQTIYMVLPDLASLTKARSLLMYGHQEREAILWITCYVLTYVVLLLVLASLVTEQREFP